MSSPPDDQALEAALLQAFRDLGEAVDLHQQVSADRLGLNRTDLSVLGFLEARGALSAGQLAEATGLTTGAVTGVIDRLERAGYARREADPDDRRRVMIALVHERLDRLEKVHRGLVEALGVLEGRFTAAERRRVGDFMRGAAEAFRGEAERLRGAAPASPAPAAGDDRTASAPLDGATLGRLSFTAGASRLTLEAGAAPGLLFSARFDGKPPRVTVRGGEVSMTYARFSPFSWRKLGATVALCAGLPWEIELRGGIARLDADLGGLRLARLWLRGGAHAVTVALPLPEGTVEVRLTGGASEVAFRRPPGVEARLRLTGGAAALTFDAQRLGAVGGTVLLETPGFSAARDRYDFEVTGGAAGLSLTAG